MDRTPHDGSVLDDGRAEGGWVKTTGGAYIMHCRGAAFGNGMASADTDIEAIARALSDSTGPVHQEKKSDITTPCWCLWMPVVYCVSLGHPGHPTQTCVFSVSLRCLPGVSHVSWVSLEASCPNHCLLNWQNTSRASSASEAQVTKYIFS